MSYECPKCKSLCREPGKDCDCPSTGSSDCSSITTYLYVDIEGRIGKADTPPTKTDIESIADGQLSVLRIRDGDIRTLDPDITDEDQWDNVCLARIEDCDESSPYHFVTG